jgi:putative peptidoglycan lipid II flippase
MAVSRVQIYLSLQIPFYVIVMLGTRMLSALDGNRIVLGVGALNLLVNVVGNYVLMQWFDVDGIAMSTSLAYAVSMVVTLVAIRSKMAEAQAGQRPPDVDGTALAAGRLDGPADV